MKLTDFNEAYDDVGQKIYKGNTTRVVNTPVADKNISVADKRIAKFSQQRDMDDMTYKGAKWTAPGTNQTIAKAKSNINRAYSKQDKIDQRQGAGQSYITKGKPVKFPSTDNVRITMDSINELKISKPDSVDTKGIKRNKMPQVATTDYPEFIDYLKDNGADFTKQTMPAKALKATQGEFSDAGVVKQLQKFIDGAKKKPVIASQDNYIIDGHHRWLVAWNTGDTIDVFKVDIDADELLDLVRKFPKVTYKDIYTEELYDFDKDQPMKSIVAVPGYGTMSIDGLMKNVIDQTTAMLKQMQQGTQGFRNADYELNRNKVLPSKIAALIQALDDLQAIRSIGCSNSRNIEKESVAEQEQEELPIDIDRIFDRIQQLESRQFIRPEDADLMRRGVQSLTASRQTLNPQAILQLLTMTT